MQKKYSRLRYFLRVKGLVICFYLGWSGSILQVRTNLIKVGSKSWLSKLGEDKSSCPLTHRCTCQFYKNMGIVRISYNFLQFVMEIVNSIFFNKFFRMFQLLSSFFVDIFYGMIMFQALKQRLFKLPSLCTLSCQITVDSK